MVSRFASLAALLCALAPAAAWAQTGLGGFVSPGPLAADHADLDSILECTACHEPGKGVSPTRCMDCHERVQEQVRARAGFHAHLGDDCASCHGDHKGRAFALVRLTEETFRHQSTGFALGGEHAPLPCVDCHTEAPKDYTGLSQGCASCHDEPHGEGASTRELIGACRVCHDADDWTVDPLPTSVFDHDDAAQADFALHLAHDDVGCIDCHAKALFVPLASALCTDCHDDVHRGQLAGACTDCHADTAPDWRAGGFWHDAARFRLRGAHADVGCASCHGTGPLARYRPVDHARCDDCHDDVHEGQFAPRDCDACHSQDPGGLREGVVDHDATDYPLRGAHSEVPCAECHGEGPAARFADLPFADCDDCHEDAHEAQFEPSPCVDCHAEDGAWAVATFDHARTAYELVGAHVDATCAGCHGEGPARTLAGVAHAACTDCHAQDDPHRGTEGARACTDCHAAQGWTPLLAFDHGGTGWPLAGRHAEPPCVDCHARTEAAVPLDTLHDAASDCAACHADDAPAPHYEGACATCHAPTGWRDASLSVGAHADTGFALRGVHAVLPCDSCHVRTEPSAAAPGECVDCHADDDPHQGQLGAECSTCHGPVDWMRTTFRHVQVGWPLRGPHRAAACSDCHAAGYVGAPSDCGSCHRGDAPGDALHRDPLTGECDLCHRAYTWDGASFIHGAP